MDCILRRLKEKKTPEVDIGKEIGNGIDMHIKYDERHFFVI